MDTADIKFTHYVVLANEYLDNIPIRSNEDFFCVTNHLKSILSNTSIYVDHSNDIFERVQSLKELLEAPEMFAEPDQREFFLKTIKERIQKRIEIFESYSDVQKEQYIKFQQQKVEKVKAYQLKVKEVKPPSPLSPRRTISEEEMIRELQVNFMQEGIPSHYFQNEDYLRLSLNQREFILSNFTEIRFLLDAGLSYKFLMEQEEIVCETIVENAEPFIHLIQSGIPCEKLISSNAFDKIVCYGKNVSLLLNTKKISFEMFEEFAIDYPETFDIICAYANEIAYLLNLETPLSEILRFKNKHLYLICENFYSFKELLKIGMTFDLLIYLQKNIEEYLTYSFCLDVLNKKGIIPTEVIGLPKPIRKLLYFYCPQITKKNLAKIRLYSHKIINAGAGQFIALEQLFCRQIIESLEELLVLSLTQLIVLEILLDFILNKFTFSLAVNLKESLMQKILEHEKLIINLPKDTFTLDSIIATFEMNSKEIIQKLYKEYVPND